MPQLIIISGCSGGGKSTLIDSLALRGEATVAEPGRRIVAEELASGGQALPWVNGIAFARRAVEMALADLDTACSANRRFFDRGLIDAAAALQHLTGELVLERLGRAYRFHSEVFLAPPWPDIYRSDRERRHGFEEASEEYHRLVAAYTSLDYQIVELPKASVDERESFLLSALE
jgi:predicted ATPase